VDGTFDAVLTYPSEVIKTRYQSSRNAFSQEKTHITLKSSMSNKTNDYSSSEISRMAFFNDVFGTYPFNFRIKNITWINILFV
jgi:hypothetical protein